MTTAQGDWYALMFQDRGAVGRIPYLMPAAWEEDWPVLGIHGKVPMEWELPMEEKNGKASDPFRFSGSSGKPAESAVAVEPQSLSGRMVLYGASRISQAEEPSESLLPDGRQKYPDPADRRAGLRLYGDAGRVGPEEGDFAGLCALEGIYGQIGLAREADGWYLQYVSGTMSGQRQTERIPAKDRRICLKAVFTYSEKEDRAAFFYRYDDENWQAFGAPVALALPWISSWDAGSVFSPTEQAGREALRILKISVLPHRTKPWGK